MVLKVTSITPKQIYAEFNKLPKEVKVAIAVLTLLAAGLAVVGIRRWLFTSIALPKELVDLVGSEEKFKKLPEISSGIIPKSSILSPTREDIAKDVETRASTYLVSNDMVPICRGKDSWDNYFLTFSFTSRSGNKDLCKIFYFAMNEGSQVVYRSEGFDTFGKDDKVVPFLKELNNNTQSNYELIPVTPKKSKATMVFPAEVRALFTKVQLDALPISYQIDKKVEKTADNFARYDMISRFCFDATEKPASSYGRGVDPWGNPFIEVRCVATDHTLQCKYIYFCENKWYLDANEFTEQNTKDLKKILGETHTFLKLIN